MNKKGSIENVARIIVNRVRYHSPIVYDDDIDFNILEEFGIDLSLPIFKFEKELTKPLMKAFALAKTVCNFNLVVTQRTNCPFALFLPTETVNIRLMQMINKLNINYKSISKYELVSNIDYLKIGGKALNLQFKDFCLEKHDSMKGVLVSQRQFVASGECNIIELCNSNSYESELQISFNKNLPIGNYFFKKEGNSLKTQNLFTKETKYLNTNLSLNNIFFSCVDGVENSSYACIKFDETIKLKPFQKKIIFINFGDIKFSMKVKGDMELLFDAAKKRCYENFDVKIFSDDKKFDENFNLKLPREIWLSWLEGKRDIKKEQEYIKAKEEICIRQKNRLIFNGENYNHIREIDVFDGKRFREIFVKNMSKENALKIGSALFQNLRSFSLDKINPKAEICLLFK